MSIDTQGHSALQGGAVLADRSVVLVGNDGTVLVSRDGGRRLALRHQGLRQTFAAVTASGASLVLVGERGVTLLPQMPETPR